MALSDANIGVYVSKELAEYTAGAYADYGSTKDQLHHFARAIEAEVRKQDEALIWQLMEALEPFGIWHGGETEDESDFFLFKDSGDVTCPTCIKLYTADQVLAMGRVPQGWKAVPVNPTPEMWKAAKTVPDPNPPYPPHYGLVWDAMLAAAPTTQPSPQQEAQEPHGWLYEWTHSSATGRPDATYTAFTTDEAHARKHDNCRAIYTAPQPSPAAQRDALDAARYRWLATEHGEWLLKRFPAVRPYCDASEVVDESVDAARTVQEGKSNGEA